MTEQMPLVSIGMPVYNCQRTLGVAIRSILLQTYQNWELFLIDDGSSDETLRVAQRFADSRIRIHSDGEWRGSPVRRNQAIAVSRGKYFACLDGDDLAYPHRFERQINYLEQHPEVDLVGAWIIVFGLGGTPLGKLAYPETHAAICARPFARFSMAHPTFVGRLEWFRHYRYDETLLKSQDQDLLLRSYRFSKFANVQEILLGYRQEKLDWRKILTSRFYHAQALNRELRKQGRSALAIRAIVEQGLKGLVDCFAVGTGLNYRILRHRARPITAAERAKWQHVWTLLNASSVLVR